MKSVKHQVYQHAILEAVVIFSLLTLAACLVSRKFRGWLGNWFSAHPNYFWLVPVLPVLLEYVFLALTGRGQQSNPMRAMIYFGLPAAVAYVTGRSRDGAATMADFCLAGFLWLFLVTGVVAHDTVHALLVLVYALVLFGSWRQLELNCSWWVKWSAWKTVGGLAALWAVSLATLWATGLVPLVPTKLLSEHQWALSVILTLWLFSQSLLAELLFRGAIQSWLGKYLPAFWSILAAAGFYGIAFVIVPAWAFPNWSGAVLATIIGGLCGYAYQRGRSVLASALLNVMLNFSWWMFFKGGR